MHDLLKKLEPFVLQRDGKTDRVQIDPNDPAYQLVCELIEHLFGSPYRAGETNFDREHKYGMSAGVYIFFQDCDGTWKTILQRRGSHEGNGSEAEGLLSLCGGFSHKGETPEDAMYREYVEETHCAPSTLQDVRLLAIHPQFERETPWHKSYSYLSVLFAGVVDYDTAQRILSQPPSKEVQRWEALTAEEVEAVVPMGFMSEALSGGKPVEREHLAQVFSTLN